MESAADVKREPTVPEHLFREKPPYDPGIRRVPVDRFYKQEYHDLEVERIWKKAWQWACREEEIPEVGDYHIYEVAELSFIVMRTAPEEFKAYWNSCPHRARKLCTFDGKRNTEIRCMFHGWAWNIDGSMKEMTSGWDFAGARPDEVKLREVKVGTWGGYVFINPDADCESLESFLGELPEHCEIGGHDFAKRWKQVHVVADLPANWKVVQEAFLEAWHVIYTHPQQVMGPARPEYVQRWDDFGNFMRWAVGPVTEGKKATIPFMPAGETEQDYIDGFLDYHKNEDPAVVATDELSGMAAVHKAGRQYLRTILGDKVDDYHEMFMSPGEMQMVWPNFHPWQNFSRLVYRFRPYKSDPNRSLMDVLLLAPWPEDKPMPPPCPPHVLEHGQPISDAFELGQLARIFSQDLANIPYVHQGLKTCERGYVILSDHNEAPLRHWHDRYDKWMGLDSSDGKIGEDA